MEEKGAGERQKGRTCRVENIVQKAKTCQKKPQQWRKTGFLNRNLDWKYEAER